MNSFFNFLIFLLFFLSAYCTLNVAKILFFTETDKVIIIRNWLGHFQWEKMLDIATESLQKQKVQDAMNYEKMAKILGLAFVLISIFKVFVLPFLM
jgi:hypothetical protein